MKRTGFYVLRIMSRKITLTRRLVQFVGFGLMIYGAFIWPKHVETILPPIPSGTPRTTLYGRDRILWVSGKESVLEIYVPFLACRFTARGGLFKSCFVHFLSENFTWRTSLKVMMSHLLVLMGLCVLAGRFWCGWLCPLGALMDVMTASRKVTTWPRLHLPLRLQRFLKNLAQFLLFASLGISLLIAFPFLGQGANDSLFLIYCQLCPARLAYPGFGGVNPCWTDTTNRITVFLTGLGWLAFGTFFLGFAIPRFWCRICAIGALVSYFNRGALLTLEKNHQKCTSCGTCQRNCPVDVERVYQERAKTVVTDAQCQFCLTCLEDCPEEGCLELKFLGKRVVQS